MILTRASLPLRHVSHLRTRVQRSKRTLTLSSVEGPLHPPLETRTLSEYFTSDILQKHSSRPALICRSETARAHYGPPSRNLGVTTHLAWDFAEFDCHINALARGLLNMGVRRGDRVGVVMGNNSAYAMLQWACSHIGAILVTVNPAYRAHELINTLKLVGVKHLFVVPHIRTSAYVEMLAHALPEMKNSSPGDIQDPGLPELRNLVVVDNKGTSWARFEKLGIKSVIDWREILMWREDGKEKDMQRDISASLKNDDIVNLQFTSGTTGAPKAVSLTHSNLLNNAISIGRCMYLTEEDSVCNVPPLFHCFDECFPSVHLVSKLTCLPIRLVLGNLAAWVHGASIVYPSEVFDAAAIIDTVAAERCTALHGVPTHFINVLAEFDKRKAAHEHPDLSRLRTGIAAGAPIPIDLMKHLIARLNLVDLTNAYGMTETSPVSFQTTPADDITKRVETVGKVQPHVKAKLIDPHGNVVPVGTPGEICIAGYLVQKGYWADEAHTRAAMKKDKNGTLWMHTGDEGIMDEDGYLRIVGRIKDIIIRGGENLFPVQIENALSEHDSVREAAVVSVPNAKYGEVVGAWICREPGSSDSREAIREFVAKSMNPQNAPAWVWFIGEDGTHDELPKTASGKVMKHVLRKWSKDLAHKNVGLVERL